MQDFSHQQYPHNKNPIDSHGHLRTKPKASTKSLGLPNEAAWSRTKMSWTSGYSMPCRQRMVVLLRKTQEIRKGPSIKWYTMHDISLGWRTGSITVDPLQLLWDNHVVLGFPGWIKGNSHFSKSKWCSRYTIFWPVPLHAQWAPSGWPKFICSKVLILGMGDLPPLIGNPYNGYINPFYKDDDHPYHRKTMGV